MDDFVNDIRTQITALSNLWDEIGAPESEKSSFLDTLKGSILAKLRYEMEKSQKHKEGLLETIAQQDKRKKEILERLGVVDIPENNGATIYEKEKAIKEEVAKLEQTLKEREETLQTYQTTLDELNDLLGYAAVDLPTLYPVVSERNLREIKVKIIKLERQRDGLLDQINQLSASVASVWQEMEETGASASYQVPSNDQTDTKALDMMLWKASQGSMSLVDIPKPLTETTVRSLQCRLEDAQQELDRRGYLVQELQQTVTDLYEMISSADEGGVLNIEPPQVIELKPTMGTITTLKTEVEKWKQKQMDILPVLIECAKDKLEGYWKHMHVPEAIRHEFVPYYVEDYSLERLEALRTLTTKRFPAEMVSSYDQIVALMQQRDELVEQRRILKEKSITAEMLKQGGFAKRLLAEEKQRKQLDKQIPALEAQLKRRVREWEEQYQPMPLMISPEMRAYDMLAEATVKKPESSIPKAIAALNESSSSAGSRKNSLGRSGSATPAKRRNSGSLPPKRPASGKSTTPFTPRDASNPVRTPASTQSSSMAPTRLFGATPSGKPAGPASRMVQRPPVFKRDDAAALGKKRKMNDSFDLEERKRRRVDKENDFPVNL